MATKTINASVGANGANRQDDVITVQQLLNGVLPAFGGPSVKLVVDGICGPKTKAAIQQFQLKQFGWQGADDRVDPGKQTMDRLNLLNFGNIDPPVPPPGPGPSILPDSNTFVIHRMGSEESFGASDDGMFFHITDMINGFIGIYFLARSGGDATNAHPPLTFHGASRSFHSKGPEQVDRLDCAAVYMSSERNGAITSTFVLNLPTGAIQIAMPHHLIGPNGLINDNGNDISTWISGDLKFVRFA